MHWEKETKHRNFYMITILFQYEERDLKKKQKDKEMRNFLLDT